MTKTLESNPNIYFTKCTINAHGGLSGKEFSRLESCQYEVFKTAWRPTRVKESGALRVLLAVHQLTGI